MTAKKYNKGSICKDCGLESRIYSGGKLQSYCRACRGARGRESYLRERVLLSQSQKNRNAWRRRKSAHAKGRKGGIHSLARAYGLTEGELLRLLETGRKN